MNSMEKAVLKQRSEAVIAAASSRESQLPQQELKSQLLQEQMDYSAVGTSAWVAWTCPY